MALASIPASPLCTHKPNVSSKQVHLQQFNRNSPLILIIFLTFVSQSPHLRGQNHVIPIQVHQSIMKAKQILPALGLSLLLTAPALVAQPTTQTQKCCSQCSQCTHKTDLSQLPRTIFSGVRGPFHVQGIAVDLKRGYIYFSFTTELLKTDLKGNLIGSVKGLTGHLGCLTMNPEDGRVYGSIEYKNDAIGREILQKLDNSEQLHNTNAFYIAIFDVDKITRPDMDAEKDSVMTTVYLKEVVDDFYATVQNGGRTVEHRHGCS